jgi:hypothetical protein
MLDCQTRPTRALSPLRIPVSRHQHHQYTGRSTPPVRALPASLHHPQSYKVSIYTTSVILLCVSNGGGAHLAPPIRKSITTNIDTGYIANVPPAQDRKSQRQVHRPPSPSHAGIEYIGSSPPPHLLLTPIRTHSSTEYITPTVHWIHDERVEHRHERTTSPRER